MDDEFPDALEATVIDDALVELGERTKIFRAMPLGCHLLTQAERLH